MKFFKMTLLRSKKKQERIGSFAENNFIYRRSGAARAAVAAAVACAAFWGPECFAGTGGTEFDSVWQTLSDWTQGALGRIIAGSMVLVGIVSGVARQSLMAFAIGIGGGVGLYNAPNVIDSVLAATMNDGAVSVIPEAILRWAN